MLCVVLDKNNGQARITNIIILSIDEYGELKGWFDE